ncbi:hypothetical protein ABG768_010198, partial [Culter alburnus]
WNIFPKGTIKKWKREKILERINKMKNKEAKNLGASLSWQPLSFRSDKGTKTIQTHMCFEYNIAVHIFFVLPACLYADAQCVAFLARWHMGWGQCRRDSSESHLIVSRRYAL